MRFRGEPFSASAFRASSKALCSPIFNPGALGLGIQRFKLSVVPSTMSRARSKGTPWNIDKAPWAFISAGVANAPHIFPILNGLDATAGVVGLGITDGAVLNDSSNSSLEGLDTGVDVGVG